MKSRRNKLISFSKMRPVAKVDLLNNNGSISMQLSYGLFDELSD